MRPTLLIAASCLLPLWGCADPHSPPASDDTAGPQPPWAEAGGDFDLGPVQAGPFGPPPLEARAKAFPSVGSVPLTVALEAKGSTGAWAVARWHFGDGTTAAGIQAQYAYLAAGSHTVTLELVDRFGQQAQDTIVIEVDGADCPVPGEYEQLGEVAYEEIDEVSGLVDSRRNPGVLWVHNDSGDGPFLYALSHSGEHLGVWEVDGASARDWEDLTTGQDPETGAWLLYVGDIGDNSETRDSIVVYRMEEPEVDPEGGEQGGTLTAAVIELEYPYGNKHNAETLMVDPVTDDLYIVTKSYDGTTGVFRKPAPHDSDELTTTEEIVWLDFSSSPLSGNATTGGAFSPLGDRIAIRTYGTTAYVWLRDGSETVAEALADDPCPVTMPSERQAETIEFSVAGDALLSISEGEAQPIHRLPFDG
jgi:PKD repeat protein